jgi:lysophospholipase L1-like esterase
MALLAATLLVLGGTDGARGLRIGSAQAVSPPFTWRLPDGYQGDPVGKGITPETSPDAIEAGRWPVDVTVQPPLCDDDGVYTWSDADGPVPNERTGLCRYTLAFPRSGNYALTLVAEIGARQHIATAEIPVRGRLIVAIGDSIASGEGVPDIPSFSHAKWQSRQCHRSARSAPALAAQTIQQIHPETPVTFISLACSGATVNAGLLGSYVGQDPQPGDAALPPQTAALRDIAGRRRIDALVISIGANDLHFGDVITSCLPALHPLSYRRCFARTATIDHRKYKTLGDAVDQAVAALPDGYAALHAALSGIPIDRIYLLQYFDPTLGADGATCRSIAGITRAVLDEARARVLIPLNRISQAAAQQYHWHYIKGTQKLFSGHGYCTDKAHRWVVQLHESALNESGGAKRLSGSLHPNADGHHQIATLIVPTLKPPLFPKPLAQPSEEEVSKAVARGLEGGGVLAFLSLGGLLYRRTAPGRRARRERTRPASQPPSG